MQHSWDFEITGTLKLFMFKEDLLNKCTIDHRHVFKRILSKTIPSKKIFFLGLSVIKVNSSICSCAGNPLQPSQGALVVSGSQFGNHSPKQLDYHITKWIKLGMSQGSIHRSHRYKINTSIYNMILIPFFSVICSINDSLYKYVLLF